MRTIRAKNKSFSLPAYEFDDLSEESKNKAISDHIDFWLEVFTYEEMDGNLKKAVDKAEQMQTPWFTASYVYDLCKDEIIEEIKANKYLFQENGELLPICYHTDKNKVVKTTFRFFGNEIEVHNVYNLI